MRLPPFIPATRLGDSLNEAASRAGENVAGRAAQLKATMESAESTLKMATQSLDVQAEARGDRESDDKGHQAAPVPPGHHDVELRAQHGLAPEEDREQDEAQPGEQEGERAEAADVGGGARSDHDPDALPQ